MKTSPFEIQPLTRQLIQDIGADRPPSIFYRLINYKISSPNLRPHLPQLGHRLLPYTANTVVADFIGTPDAGKSTTIKELVPLVSPFFDQVVSIPAFSALSPDRLSPVRKSDLDRLAPFHKERALIRAKLLTFENLVLTNGILTQLLDDLQNHRHPPKRLYITERGPADALPNLHWALDLNPRSISSPQDRKQIVTELFDSAIALTEKVDVIVNLTTDLATAQAHRTRAGKPRESELVNPHRFPAQETAYALFMTHGMLPLLRETNGTGTVVLDGRSPLKENVAILRDYFQRIATQMS